jgi:hypothetical protein
VRARKNKPFGAFYIDQQISPRRLKADQASYEFKFYMAKFENGEA